MISFLPIIAAIIRGIIAVWNVDKEKSVVRRGVSRLRIRKAVALLANNFIDSKQLFVQLNRELPNVMLINGIDVNKAIILIEAKLDNIRAVYRHEQFDFADQQIVFNMIIIVTRDGRIVEISSIYNYVELLYTADQAQWADYMAKELSTFRLNVADGAIARNVRITGFAGREN
jgi:hypothetical protein